MIGQDGLKHVHKATEARGLLLRRLPVSNTLDGDTLFALATGQIDANVNVIGAYAAEVVAQAIRNGVRAATTLGGVRAWNE